MHLSQTSAGPECMFEIVSLSNIFRVTCLDIHTGLPFRYSRSGSVVDVMYGDRCRSVIVNLWVISAAVGCDAVCGESGRE